MEKVNLGSMFSRFQRLSPEEARNGTVGANTGDAGSAPQPQRAERPEREKKEGGATATFSPRVPRYEFKDLVLPKKVMDELEVLDSMIRNHALVYEGWGMRSIDPYGGQKSFNVFGPPGTGKTMIVEALASRWGKPLIDVDMSQMESKYVGETGKNIAAAFKAAREADAVLLFDEADAVLGKRLTDVRQSADQSVNTSRSVMLKQLEAHDGIVAFATNFPANYDAAFVRRILKHIQVPLPDKEGRRKLFEKKIPPNAPGRDELDWDRLAELSDMLSGGDILVAVKNACFDAVRRPEQRLTTEILLAAITNARIAKAQVGNSGDAIIETVRKDDASSSGTSGGNGEQQ